MSHVNCVTAGSFSPHWPSCENGRLRELVCRDQVPGEAHSLWGWALLCHLWSHSPPIPPAFQRQQTLCLLHLHSCERAVPQSWDTEFETPAC